MTAHYGESFPPTTFRKAEPILERVTAAIAGAHFALAALLFTGKAGFGRQVDGLIPSAAEHPMWIASNIIAGILIVCAIAKRHWRRYSMAVSVGVFAGWSTLMGVWAIQLSPDATWAVTCLGLALALVSFVTNGQWSVKED